ncbi:MAG TPA: nucleotidyltransferase domain-containing protein [Gammaproteobacteria bacterium]|nr:nucleotidyltransferase domain-containing protein [Gammaproteobacteria bacterium]
MLYTELPLTAQTTFAQLQDVVLAEHVSRSVAQLRGNFARKSVKGRDYWYFVFRESGYHRQIYVGPDEPRVRALVEKKRDANSSQIAALARAYVAQGATTLLAKHLRVIARLTDFGFFRAGGVLAGTHAFAAFANLLGVRWTGGDRTMDVDVAIPGKNVSIALPDAPQANLHDALSTFEAGFIPTQTFTGGTGPTYSLRGEPDLQIDFLTTLHRGGEAPRRIEALSVTAQPLKFLDYLLEAPTQGVLLDRTGHCTVANLPEPARYSVHKLIVHGERTTRQRTKARKDLEQSAALLQWHAAHDAERLMQSWNDALERGPGWRSRLRAGIAALSKYRPLDEIGWVLGKSSALRPT